MPQIMCPLLTQNQGANFWQEVQGSLSGLGIRFATSKLPAGFYIRSVKSSTSASP